MQFDPTKLTLNDLDQNYIRNKIEQDHDAKCPTDHPIIFVDWNRSIDKGQLNFLHHDWRDPASGFTSVIVDDKFSKSGKI